MQDQFYNDYVAYFKNLATQHKSILHTPESIHFVKMDLEEALTSSRSELQYPAFILESYDLGFTDNKSDNILKNRTGAFMVLVPKTREDGVTDLDTIIDAAEAICDDIFSRMKQDQEARHDLVVNFDLNSVQGTRVYIPVLGSAVGMRYEFTLSTPNNMDIDPDKWLDLTP